MATSQRSTTNMMVPESKIYIAGHTGMVGSALCRHLLSQGFNNLVLRTSTELDLRNQAAVNFFFETEQPEYVFLPAGKVGGILHNDSFRGEFIFDNLMIGANVIHAAHKHTVKKLLYFGSACVYPKNAKQPIKEDSLLSSELEATNEPYAIAKIACIKLCEAYNKQYGNHFISVMPTNLFGPNDNDNLETSHVIPALIRKFYEAKINQHPEVTVWGSGNVLREFLHVDDLAKVSLFLMQEYDEQSWINVGSGEEFSIKELSELIQSMVGYMGNIIFDSSMPEGVKRKILDTTKLNALRMTISPSFKTQLERTVRDYIAFRNK